ncbi:MAG: DUF4129 domain-containing protein [bacterium]
MLLLQSAQRAWPAAAVHDTVAAVVRDAEFQRSLQRSIADVIMLWLAEWFGRFMRFIRHAPSARTIAIGVVILIVITVAARLIIAARARDDGKGRASSRRGSVSSDDPWVVAERLIAEARFEEAAHALYHGVLAGLALNERIRLDPSRTSGDYARELGRRGSSASGPFRSFIRRFDVAVYGHGGCDADAVSELRELSIPFRARARAA